MDVYLDYDATIKAWSAGLSPWHSLIYCLTVCRRSAVLYHEFADREGWGDKEAIALTHELLVLAIAGSSPPSDIVENCIARLDFYTPDTEEFDCSYALDAAVIHFYSAELLQGHKPENVHHVARTCYDIVDASVFGEVMPGGGIVTRKIERQVEQHPYLRDEITWQRRVRDELASVPEGNTQLAEARILEWSAASLLR
jgi:hypothetical protein